MQSMQKQLHSQRLVGLRFNHPCVCQLCGTLELFVGSSRQTSFEGAVEGRRETLQLHLAAWRNSPFCERVKRLINAPVVSYQGCPNFKCLKTINGSSGRWTHQGKKWQRPSAFDKELLVALHCSPLKYEMFKVVFYQTKLRLWFMV